MRSKKVNSARSMRASAGSSAYRLNNGAALSLYMKEVGMTPLLTPEEERALAIKVTNGDKAAREHMIKANLRLVVKIARDYECNGLPLLDLISEGNIGLMIAVDKYDPDHEAKAKFATYAAWWIKQSIKRALANTAKTVRLPVHVVDSLFLLRKTNTMLEGVLGRPPTDSELSDEMGCKESKVRRLRGYSRSTISLEEPLGSEEDSDRVGDIIADTNAPSPVEVKISKDLSADIAEAFREILTPKEVEILKRRFGLDGKEEETLEEVGARYSLTRERIRQVQNAALKKIRRNWQNRDERMAKKFKKERSRSLTA